MPLAASALGRLLSRLTRADPQAGVVGTFADPGLDGLALFGAAPSKTGQMVSATTAMQCAAVYACVRVLAESMAQLPLSVYKRRADGGSDEVPDHPLYAVLHDAPNGFQTSFEWREMQMGHVALRGNAYCIISRTVKGVAELLPLHPDRVRVTQLPDWSLRYDVAGTAEPLKQADVLHLHGLSSCGVYGLSPIAQARETIGLALAAEDHGARLFGNGASPSGVLEHPGKLSDDARKNLKESWQKAHGGPNRHGTAILEEGLKWAQLAITNKDAQFLETRQYQRAEIASLFRIPPHLIGDLTRATFSNIEQQSLEFVIHTLMPWVKRWEQRLTRQLLSDTDRRTYYVRFKVDGLLRGDIAARYTAYGAAIKDGWMNRNEIRALEGLNRAEGLDEYLSPLNMTTQAEAQAAQAADQDARTAAARAIAGVGQTTETVHASVAAVAAAVTRQDAQLTALTALVQRPAPAPPALHIEDGAIQVHITNAPRKGAVRTTFERDDDGRTVAAIQEETD